jgi:hypothetical protein
MYVNLLCLSHLPVLFRWTLLHMQMNPTLVTAPTPPPPGRGAQATELDGTSSRSLDISEFNHAVELSFLTIAWVWEHRRLKCDLGECRITGEGERLK